MTNSLNQLCPTYFCDFITNHLRTKFTNCKPFTVNRSIIVDAFNTYTVTELYIFLSNILPTLWTKLIISDWLVCDQTRLSLLAVAVGSMLQTVRRTIQRCSPIHVSLNCTAISKRRLQYDCFADRHIGCSDIEKQLLLNYLGFKVIQFFTDYS